jgi:IS6 family transposase
VQRFTPLLIDAARPCRHSVGDRWFVDETYVKVAGVWRYVYRAVDQYSQVIDVYVSKRRNLAAARTFFNMVLASHGRLEELTTDLAAPLLRLIDELLADVLMTLSSMRTTDRERSRPAQSKVETDAWSANRPTASVVIRGHAFVQNLRDGHYELGVEARHEQLRLAAAFDELADAI